MFRNPPLASARRMAGGTLLGLVLGVLVGLAIAAAVAVYITKSPVPFVDRVGHAPTPIPVPQSPAETPDPNKPLYSKNHPAGAAGAAGEAPAAPAAGAPGPGDEDKASILDRLFGKGTADSVGVVKPAPQTAPAQGAAGGADQTGAAGTPPPAAPAAASPRQAPAPAPAAKPATGGTAESASGPTSYLLQAGAFRSADEADSMKARLALLGLEARVIPAQVGGQTVYRVRVGPYGQLDEMNRARARLAENGIEASVLRQK